MLDQNRFSSDQYDRFILKLQWRFEKNMHRHPGMDWSRIQCRIDENLDKLWSLFQMEQTGGEPDVVTHDEGTGEYIFYDCSIESPVGRRSLCYDRAGLDSRKEFKPASSAIDMAESMGIEMLTVTEYRALQQIEKFDLKTSSWILTPMKIRQLGGAIFGDRRYDTVFIYHNGAQSYYAARGFRGSLRL